MTDQSATDEARGGRGRLHLAGVYATRAVAAAQGMDAAFEAMVREAEQSEAGDLIGAHPTDWAARVQALAAVSRACSALAAARSGVDAELRHENAVLANRLDDYERAALYAIHDLHVEIDRYDKVIADDAAGGRDTTDAITWRDALRTALSIVEGYLPEPATDAVEDAADRAAIDAALNDPANAGPAVPLKDVLEAAADHSQPGPRRVVATLTQLPGGPVTVDAWIHTVRIGDTVDRRVYWSPDGLAGPLRLVGVAARVDDGWDAWEPHAWDTRDGDTIVGGAPWDQFESLDEAAACLVALAQRADATKQTLVAAHAKAEPFEVVDPTAEPPSDPAYTNLADHLWTDEAAGGHGMDRPVAHMTVEEMHGLSHTYRDGVAATVDQPALTHTAADHEQAGAAGD